MSEEKLVTLYRVFEHHRDGSLHIATVEAVEKPKTYQITKTRDSAGEYLGRRLTKGEVEDSRYGWFTSREKAVQSWVERARDNVEHATRRVREVTDDLTRATEFAQAEGVNVYTQEEED